MSLHRPLRPSTAAARLLAGLGAPGSYAVADPTAPGSLILRCARAGISLGNGRFKLKVADLLVAADLAQWTTVEQGPRRIEITDAGRAHLRRRMAETAEDGFIAQHLTLTRAVIEATGGPTSITIDAEESPLAWLSRRKDTDGRPFLDAAAFGAGERLRRDLTIAGMLPSVTARWDIGVDRGGSRGPADAAATTDVMVAARQRVTLALKDVGEDFADLLIDVCGFLKGLEVVERERRWPPRSGKVVVRLALWRLAEHYGLEREARGPETSRGVRSWREALVA
jgi:hypothetical protein